MSWRRKLLVAPFIVYALIWSQPSLPAGALAVGVPPDVAKQGFAAGHAVNAATMDEARKRAIDGCHKSVGASAAAMKLCNVVATFSNQCMAVAIGIRQGRAAAISAPSTREELIGPVTATPSRPLPAAPVARRNLITRHALA
jgi:hypothetical protein